MTLFKFKAIRHRIEVTISRNLPNFEAIHFFVFASTNQGNLPLWCCAPRLDLVASLVRVVVLQCLFLILIWFFGYNYQRQKVGKILYKRELTAKKVSWRINTHQRITYTKNQICIFVKVEEKLNNLLILLDSSKITLEISKKGIHIGLL